MPDPQTPAAGSSTHDEFRRRFTAKPCNICGRSRDWSLDGQLQAVCYRCGNPMPKPAAGSDVPYGRVDLLVQGFSDADVAARWVSFDGDEIQTAIALAREAEAAGYARGRREAMEEVRAEKDDDDDLTIEYCVECGTALGADQWRYCSRCDPDVIQPPEAKND